MKFKEFLSTLVDKEDLPEVIAHLLKGGRKISFYYFLSHDFHFTGSSLVSQNLELMTNSFCFKPTQLSAIPGT